MVRLKAGKEHTYTISWYNCIQNLWQYISISIVLSSHTVFIFLGPTDFLTLLSPFLKWIAGICSKLGRLQCRLQYVSHWYRRAGCLFGTFTGTMQSRDGKLYSVFYRYTYRRRRHVYVVSLIQSHVVWVSQCLDSHLQSMKSDRCRIDKVLWGG